MKDIRALFILHYSPPVHGASKVGDFIKESQILNESLNIKFIKIKSSQKLDEIGLFSILKIYYLLELFFKVIMNLLIFRPKIIYYTASPVGFAFYRDLLITRPIRIYQIVLKTKIFYHYHAKGIRDFTKKSTLNRRLTNWFVKNVNLVFISPIMNEEVDFLKTHKTVSFLCNGVDSHLSSKEFLEILEYRSSTNKINVLYLSNMIKEKGYDTVLELAKQTKEAQINHIEFNFAGSWATKEDEQLFNQYVSEHNLNNCITYNGLVEGNKKKALFSKATIFIFPSRYKKEVFPLSILEALSYGLPILAFNVGAVSEIIHNKVGVLSNKELIFEDLNKMIVNYQSDISFKRCREEYLNNYTIEVFEKKLLEILTLN